MIDPGEGRLTDSLIFPNPARGKITLRNIEGKYQVTILDMTDRTVSSHIQLRNKQGNIRFVV